MAQAPCEGEGFLWLHHLQKLVNIGHGAQRFWFITVSSISVYGTKCHTSYEQMFR